MPSEFDTPTNVALLGDAMHAVAPTLGRGLNLAMRDAALLGRQLKASAAREKQLPEALETYEAELVRHGFDIVRESVASVSSVWDKTRFPDKRKHWTDCGLGNYATLSASPFEHSTLRISTRRSRQL
ncbi:hypothetical protein BH10ACI4_BH10ACI4_23020 [soil metagenome]